MLLARIAAGCNNAGFDIDDSRRAELAVEELFANTVNHAYCGESDRPVWLRVSTAGAGVFVEYQDAGPPFDPFMPADPPAKGAPPNLTVGGLGRRLILVLATTSNYERRDGRNVVSLEFVRRSS